MPAKKKTKAPNLDRTWAIAVTLSVLVGLYFLRDYLAIMLLGSILAFVFYPVYSYLLRKLKSSGGAALLTALFSVLLVGIPLIIVISITVSQALNFANSLGADTFSINDQGLVESLNDVADTVNERVESWFGVGEAISAGDIESFAEQTLPQLANAFADILLGIVSGIPNFFTMLIIYFFVFISALTNGKEALRALKDMSPFDDKTDKQLLDRAGAMSKAMLKGQLLIAIAQGVTSALVLSLVVGSSEYTLFFSVLFTFLSFIPLGAGILTIPIGFFLIVVGNLGGIFLLLNHFIVVTNIDNYIRPKVVPENAQMPAVFTIISTFAGVTYFGFVGVIFGPMIMILILTIIEGYREYKASLAA